MKLLFEIIIVQNIMYARYPASRIYLNSAHTNIVNKKNRPFNMLISNL